MKSIGLSLLANCAFITLVHAASVNVIYSFEGGADGEYADTDLVRDSAGNLYGTTVQGGTHASGTVWQLHPNGDGSWTHIVLYSFSGGADGAEPYKGVTLDAAGNIYGTAVTGGGGVCEGGCGVAYKLTNNGGSWTQSVIHQFTGGDDGSGPGARLTLDDSGNVYGMAPTGGANGAGTIFEMRPAKHGTYRLKVLHAFTGIDGIGGSAGALVMHDGSLFGAATAGGTNGAGTIYRLSLDQRGMWKFKVIYNFLDEPDAGFPYGGLTFDALGNIYGTTYYACANDIGCVYELSPRRGEWKEKVLYSFSGSDGSGPIGSVNLDSAGNIYGTTSEGGAAADGVIFKLVPGAHRHWSENVVHSFAGSPDGEYAYNGMLDDGAGHFFGTTVHGGAHDDGAIYQFNP
ncbi:MAG TPA: choice-of-anchor tandem repeat GloVer-containing protein [Rhizomicrobium sp.]|nr:choice-of-anchor tandem repeat GloVer-containing protein [Rhizomicrobium sp.]